MLKSHCLQWDLNTCSTSSILLVPLKSLLKLTMCPSTLLNHGQGYGEEQGEGGTDTFSIDTFQTKIPLPVAWVHLLHPSVTVLPHESVWIQYINTTMKSSWQILKWMLFYFTALISQHQNNVISTTYWISDMKHCYLHPVFMSLRSVTLLDCWCACIRWRTYRYNTVKWKI